MYYLKINLLIIFFSSFVHANVVIDEPMPSMGDGRSSAVCTNGMSPSLEPYSFDTGSNRTNRSMSGISYGTWNNYYSSDVVTLTYYYYVDFYYGSNAHVDYYQESYTCDYTPPSCPTGQVLTDEGQCVDEDDTFQCRDGYFEEYSVGINTIPTPCSDFDPTIYSDSYTAVYETADTYQVCCVKALSDSDASDSNGTSSEDSNGSVGFASSSDIAEVVDAQSDTTEALQNLASDLNSSSSLTNSVLESIDSTLDVFTEEERERYLQTRADQAQINQRLSDQYNQDRQNTLDVLSSLSSINSNVQSNQVANSGKYDDLILGLRDVVNATDRIGEQANENSQVAHDDATGIKDAVDGLNDGREEAEGDLQGIRDGIDDAMQSANNNYSSVIETFNGLLTSYSNTPPTFRGSGNSVFSTVVYGHSVVFDLAMFEDLRPYFDIIFVLMLAWINFKVYRWILEFLIKIGV